MTDLTGGCSTRFGTADAWRIGALQTSKCQTLVCCIYLNLPPTLPEV